VQAVAPGPGNIARSARAMLWETGRPVAQLMPADVVQSGPVRTCIGCRERAHRSVLLRVVAARAGGVMAVVPDPRHAGSGRGASLHPDLRCFDLAERRRAFTRALRRRESLDLTPVREYLADRATPAPTTTESGTDVDEHSALSSQRLPINRSESGTDADEHQMLSDQRLSLNRSESGTDADEHQMLSDQRLSLNRSESGTDADEHPMSDQR
jgi:uncharacterized protein